MKTTAMNQSLCTTSAISSQCSQSNNLLKRIADTLQLYAARWSRRYRLRSSLYEMNTSLIEKDIGVPQGTLSEEAHKPFWRD